MNPFQIHTRDEDLEVEFLEGTEAALQRWSYEKGFQKQTVNLQENTHFQV